MRWENGEEGEGQLSGTAPVYTDGSCRRKRKRDEGLGGEGGESQSPSFSASTKTKVSLFIAGAAAG